MKYTDRYNNCQLGSHGWAMERGRPRGFDIDTALDQALAVFWRDGFQGASLAELTAAMGINKPSLYAAFGDKEGLYLKALDRYAQATVQQSIEVLEAGTSARRAVEDFLRRSARNLVDPALPGGCFVVNGIAAGQLSATPPAVAAALRDAMCGSEAPLRARLQRAQAAGELPASADVDALATFFNAVVAGMGVLAKGGARRAKLDTVVDAALACWPLPDKRARPPDAVQRSPAM